MEIANRINEFTVNVGETHAALLDGLITTVEYMNKILWESENFLDAYTKYIDDGGHCYLAVTPDLRHSLQFSERTDIDAIKRARTWTHENELDHTYLIRLGKGCMQDMCSFNKKGNQIQVVI